MDGRTHFVAGVVVGAAVGGQVFGLREFDLVLAGLTGGVAALLPDVDTGESAAWRLVGGAVGLNALIHAVRGEWARAAMLLLGLGVAIRLLTGLGHRGAAHSLAGMAGMALLLALLVGAYTGTGWPAADLAIFAAGYLSHLWLDMLTPAGVPLLWPWPRRFGLGGALVVVAVAALVWFVPALGASAVRAFGWAAEWANGVAGPGSGLSRWVEAEVRTAARMFGAMWADASAVAAWVRGVVSGT